jgi:hypothetical protein
LIPLAVGTESVNNGDDANGYLKFDIALTGKSSVGDLVWKDLNCNGVQNTGEPGIAGVMVTITYPHKTTATKLWRCPWKVQVN